MIRICLTYMSHIYVDMHAYTCIYCHTIYRAWQRKLYSLVSDTENRAQIYACLWLLISDTDVKNFLKNENNFCYTGVKEKNSL